MFSRAEDRGGQFNHNIAGAGRACTSDGRDFSSTWLMEFWWGGVFVCRVYMRGWVWVILDGEMASQAATLTRPAHQPAKRVGHLLQLLSTRLIDFEWMLNHSSSCCPAGATQRGCSTLLSTVHHLSLFSSFRRCPAVDVWRINRMESTPPVNSLDTPFSHRVSTHTCIPLPPPPNSPPRLCYTRDWEKLILPFSLLHCTALLPPLWCHWYYTKTRAHSSPTLNGVVEIRT